MKIEVHKQGGTRKVIQIDEGATKGATVGVNVWNQDGTLFVPFVGDTDPELAITYWSLILEIPLRVVALAQSTGLGLYAITSETTGETREIEGVPGRTLVTDGDGVAGNPIVDLDELVNTGTGIAPVKIYTRDAYGRIEGDQDANTDNLPEGATNLYFTNERAQDAVGSILQGVGGDVELHYADGTPLIFANLSSAILSVIGSALQPGDNVSELVNDAGYLTASTGVPASRTLTAGIGLDGGGDLSANRTFDLDAASQTSLALADSAVQPGDAATTLNMATARLLGRSTAGAGAVEEIQVGSGLALSAGTLSATGGGGTVDTITAADSTVVVDSTDPENPTIRFTHIPTNTIVGRNDAGTGVAEALTASEVRTMLNVTSGASVSSVALSMPVIFSVSGSPITGAGTITVTAADQFANTVYAGPSGGPTDPPTFRALVASDIPILTTGHLSDVSSGTYTPTITNVTNVAASTSNGAQYMRVGDTVTVSGSVDIDPTAAAPTTIRISLPIASNFAANHDCAGTMSSGNGEVGPVFASIANDNAQVQFTATNTANHAFYYQFTYRII